MHPIPLEADLLEELVSYCSLYSQKQMYPFNPKIKRYILKVFEK
jgi:hypothetical protein